ncbi:hypothetical protein GN956_G11023 [Arapaima gigas]
MNPSNAKSLLLYHLLIMFSSLAYVQCQTGLMVLQWPSQMAVSQGSSVDLECNQSDSNTYMYWYRQQESPELQLLYLSPFMSEAERGRNISGRFTVTRRRAEHITLSISGTEKSDTGVYFCATSPTSGNSVPPTSTKHRKARIPLAD